MITCKLVLKMHAVQKREKAKQDYFSSLKFQNKLRPPFEENLMNPMALLFFISFFSSFFVLFFYQNNVRPTNVRNRIAVNEDNGLRLLNKNAVFLLEKGSISRNFSSLFHKGG